MAYGERRPRPQSTLVPGGDNHRDAKANGVVCRLAENTVGVVANPTVENLTPTEAEAGHQRAAPHSLFESLNYRRRGSETRCGQHLDVDQLGLRCDPAEYYVIAGNCPSHVRRVQARHRDRFSCQTDLVHDFPQQRRMVLVDPRVQDGHFDPTSVRS